MSEHPNVANVRAAYQAVERGDMEAFAGALDEDILWHESMPGFEGDYQGPGEVLALLRRVFETTGMELNDLTIEHVLADDTHAAVFLRTTFTLGGQQHNSSYVDLYRLRNGKAVEHHHLPLDPAAEVKLFGS